MTGEWTVKMKEYRIWQNGFERENKFQLTVVQRTTSGYSTTERYQDDGPAVEDLVPGINRGIF